MNYEKKSTAPILKAFILAVFVAGAILLFRFTPLAEYLHPHAIKGFIAISGPLAPLVFILAYGVGICFFLPAKLFTGVGALLFGTLGGFLYNCRWLYYDILFCNYRGSLEYRTVGEIMGLEEPAIFGSIYRFLFYS